MIEKMYDIAVIGGGLCGFASAVKAAWNGKKVILVERRPVLGWESTWAFQLDFDKEKKKFHSISYDGTFLSKRKVWGANTTVACRIKDELSKVGGFKQNRADAPILEMTLDRLANQAGVSVLLYSYPVRLIFENDVAFGVVIGNKSGEQIIKAKVIVDATEEALLWRQADLKALGSVSIPPRFHRDVPPARQTIFFNHAESGMDLPLNLSDGITVHPSVWTGEVCVEFDIDKNDALSARRSMPDILKLVRQEIPQLKNALVTHSGNEPFPIAPTVHFPPLKKGGRGDFESVGPKHPNFRNLFGAGIWAEAVENTPAGRLALGASIGEMASECEGVGEFPSEMMTGSLISEPEVMSDVLVVGGGTGGAIAAIAAGREGAKTTLIEASPSLGGIGTGGAIHSYYYGVNGGIQDEVDERVKSLTPLFAGKWGIRGFHPDVKKFVLQQMAEEAGVDILLNTVVTGVLRNGLTIQRRTETGTSITLSEKKENPPPAPSGGGEEINELVGVIAVGTEGISAYGAKVFIDSTGDGDVAVMAGAPFIIGREKDNLPHAFSQSSGRLDKDGNLTHNNFDAGYVDPSDVEDLTRGRRLGINQYWSEKFTDDNRLLYLAPIIGIRQSIQIIGEYQLTLADEIAGRRFEDAISYTVAHYDNHGHDYENESDEAALWVWALGNWQERIGCEVPYRCLLPKNVDGLLLACRALSMTYDAHMEFRMQNDIQRIGEVAGIAAAMAAKNGISPREIDVKELQAMLKETGILDEKYRPKPAIMERKAIQLPAPEELDAKVFASLTDAFGLRAKELVWISSQRDSQSALVLKNMLNSDNPHIRFRASAALALHGVDVGVSELLQCVVERREEKTEGVRTVPLWQAAITFLGIAKDKKAVPALIGILEDEAAGLDALIGAVRSLGRIGASSAIPALRNFLKRENIPAERVMNSGMRAIEDAKWQIELTVAEALSQLGAPKDEVRKIIEPYLNDQRAYVRRYAKKLL